MKPKKIVFSLKMCTLRRVDFVTIVAALSLYDMNINCHYVCYGVFVGWDVIEHVFRLLLFFWR